MKGCSNEWSLQSLSPIEVTTKLFTDEEPGLQLSGGALARAGAAGSVRAPQEVKQGTSM